MPGPSGAAIYKDDLMPVGGFNQGGFYQQRTFPTSGRGAANISRNSFNNDSCAAQASVFFQPGTSQRNAKTNYGGNQQDYRVSNSGNRGTCRGRGMPPRTATAGSKPQPSVSSQNPSVCNTAGQNVNFSSAPAGRGYGNQTSRGNIAQKQNKENYQTSMYKQNGSVAKQQYGAPSNQQMLIQPSGQSYNRYPQQNAMRGNQYPSGPIASTTFVNQPADEVDEWDNSFTDTQAIKAVNTSVNTSNNNVQTKNSEGKSTISELQKSLHVLTVDVDGMKRWNKFKDSIQIMFEIYGQMDSAIARGVGESKEFLIRDDKKTAITCVFYEIDRCLPKMTRGQRYRIMGTYDSCKEKFMCLAIRPVKPQEVDLRQHLITKSNEVMSNLTRHLREQ